MGRRAAVLLATGLLVAACGVVPAQDGGPTRYYLPHRSLGIPVDLSRLRPTDARPTEAQLYVAYGRGQLKAGPRLAIDALQDIGGGQKGFVYPVEKDGGYEVGLQLFYADGSASPATAAEVKPQYDLVVDTTAPDIRIEATATGVEWAAADDNLDPNFAELQCKWPSSTTWTTVNKTFRSTDSHTWPLKAGQVLEVRVKVRDRATNDQWSRVVRVPGDAAVGASFPRTGGRRDPFGAAANLPQPRFEYVAKRDVSVEYTVPKMGRSGVKAVRLYALPTIDGVQDPGGWGTKPVQEFEVKLKPGDTPAPLPYQAAKDGVYGFYVAPVSGAGEPAPAPRENDPPMLYVVVDTQAPFVQITGVRVMPGVGKSARVEITWDAADPNLLPNPVNLEWSTDKDSPKWEAIKHGLDNNAGSGRGRYIWDVPDDNPWQFYVRARAVDKAGNTGTHVWDQKRDASGVPQGDPRPVIVDLEVPEAKVSGVKPTGAGAERRPDMLPKSDAPPLPGLPKGP